ncbi:S-adenosylmethionine-diacylglycerol 3-amino-3-carboxypropyl transferase [Methylohalomonas lacus]|uniref:S-adenosylmethionine-diacylglycerol 3-amino-3-carboxypropyl transferase n=1 Tax=Methylohalomonas lacus TaxID=398773 RepID=A0AAE3HHK7_9GAMM|nr:BtaA family protein [Methylohalomonas lacus]MCS3902466.1 S-adenosylmethionine-diacylglycerol 3-amino-3-carboxypropyl transferase [Methylohalomonas lacus]
MATHYRRRFLNATQDLFFRTFHNNNLIYNACWEDPRIDRELLQLDSNSRVVMLTSAGCNALDYLLDAPAEIHAVDVNPRQNALLALKLALIERGDFNDLFAMFGQGSHSRFRDVYASARNRLPDYAQMFWDRRIEYFDSNSRKRSFYYHGGSGVVAWLLTRYLLREKRPLKTHLLDLIDAESIAEQKAIYSRIEPYLWGRFIAWTMRQPLTMTMLGVPRAQARLISDNYPGGIHGFLSDKLRRVATEVLIRDNYFWRVYLTGAYTRECCPNYLKPKHFDHLRRNIHRVQPHNASVAEFLRRQPGAYTHYVLLDHQDWLAWHQPEALAEEWRLILANSAPGARILMRSAGERLDFLPGFILDSLRFYPKRTSQLHLQDRVGTYGSLHFAEVV